MSRTTPKSLATIFDGASQKFRSLGDLHLDDAERGEWPFDKLPHGWSWVKFDDVFEDVTDSRRKPATKDYCTSGKHPIVDQGETFISGYSDNDEMVQTAVPPYIVFGDHTKCIKYIETRFIQGADGVKVLSARHGFDLKYLYHALIAVRLPDKGYSRHAKFLKATYFPVCDLSNQGRIAKRLEHLACRATRAREELERIPALIQRYREAILVRAFNGELTLGWRKAHSSKYSDNLEAYILNERDERRRREGVRAKGRNRSVTGIKTQLPTIADQWCWLTFDDCAWDLTVGHVGSMKQRYVSSGVPFLKSLNVRPNSLEWQSDAVFIDEAFDKELAKSRLKPGDLVVVRTGEPGVAAVVPNELPRANCSDLIIARLVPSMNPRYAAYYMNSEFARTVVRRAQVGVAQQHFNVGSMSEMPVPCAPAEEQAEIVQRIEKAFAWLDRVAAEHANASRLLPKLDQAILAKAFRGELVTE